MIKEQKQKNSLEANFGSLNAINIDKGVKIKKKKIKQIIEISSSFQIYHGSKNFHYDILYYP